MRGLTIGVLCVAFGAACGSKDRGDSAGDDGLTTLTNGSTGIGGPPPPTDTMKLDALGGTGTIPCDEGGDCGGDCVEASHTPCDDGTTDVFTAIGLNCPDETQVTGTVSGHPGGLMLASSFGNTAEWDPTEGVMMAALGTGFVSELFMETPPADNDGCPTLCNDDFDQVVASCADPAKNVINQYDPGGSLPAPLQTNDVGGDCTMNAALLGTGDCSNTIQGQFTQGLAAHDYSEIRFTATVPEGNNSFSYDFAFFSTEYPFYFGSEFNDMYVAWLESEAWTGNVSFDEAGNPISLNAGFLDFRDDAGSLPEFGGTCMKQHAGTKWLTTTAPVVPGENIEVVLAIFDLSDSILDSYALIDNWRWGCDGEDGPVTVPEG